MKKVKSLLLLSVIPSFFFLISCTQEQTQNQILEEVSSKMKQFLNEDEKLKSDVIQKLDFKKISENKASLDITLESSFMSIFSNPKARLNLEVKISNINKRIYKRKNEFEKNNATFLIDNINPSLDYKVEIIKINDKEVALTESESNNFHFQIKATKPAPKKEEEPANNNTPPTQESSQQEQPKNNDSSSQEQSQPDKNEPQQDQKTPSSDNQRQFTLPDNFRFPTQQTDLSANEYPSFASKYRAIDPQALYKELYDRTFSVKFWITLNKGVKNYGSPENKFLATENGTTWLLDYHKKDENNYKLFFATNLHVASHLSNTLDENLLKNFNYEDPSHNKATSISLGKSSTEPNSFLMHNNNYDFSTNQNNITKFYASDPNFKNANYSDLSASVTTKTEAFSAPKLIFAGYDFIDRKYIQPFQDELQQRVKGTLDHSTDDEETNEYSEYKILQNALKTKEFIPLYTDFAVFELDVNLANADSTLKSWILKAINALNEYIKRNKENELPNQDKSISNYMQSMDYVSAKYLSNNSQYLTNSKNAYVLGYPGIDNGKSTLAWNNPTERNDDNNPPSYWRSPKNKEAFAISSDGYQQKMLNQNLNPYTKVFHRVLGDYYGFTNNIKFSSLYFGASGSLVYNEFGQMIGIYSGVQVNGEKWNLLKFASYTPFLLSNDFRDGDNNKVIKAYNLIDGSNKQKFPAQTRSYRQNLQEIYPNGFENGNFTTALFPNGFK